VTNRRAPTGAGQLKGITVSTEQVISEALNDARLNQAAARNRPAEPVMTDELDTARLGVLGRTSPGAAVAGALLSCTGWPPVALDVDTGKPSSPPLDTPGAIWQHYRHRAGDGAGLLVGDKPGGAVLVAVTGTAKAWTSWLAEKGVERTVPRYDDGSGAPVVTYRELGASSAVSWQPPPTSMRSSGVAVGGAELNRAAESMRGRHIGADEAGWLVWAAPPDAGRTLRFPSRRSIGHGVDVLGEGIVPWHSTRPDRWTTTATRIPVVEPMPPWLIAELGGRWATSKAGAR